MLRISRVPSFRTAIFTVLVSAFAFPAHAGDADPRLQALAEQNRRLEEQVRAQQKTIEELSARMADILRATNRQDRELKDLKEQLADAGPAPSSPSAREHEVRVAGEAGIAFFSTGAEGPFPHGEIRVDDPVVTVEAPVMRNAYFFGELKLLTRETNTDAFQLGELYVDFEDVSAWWGQPGQLSFRAGRINTPFGEEYQVRGPVANPLLSHSLSDIWGTDEGAEIYGRLGAVRYVVAVQNGGVSRLRDFNPDKAVVARLSVTPASWLRLSGSVMRTGELDARQDYLSDVWFANAFFRSIGTPATTGVFWADLGELDASVHWKTGHAGAAVGLARYDDNDPAADHARRMRFGYLELVQNIADHLYGAARYSAIRAPGGYPLAGAGDAGDYFYRPSMTDSLERLSVGLGYRIGPPLVLKVEYSWNTGHLLGGERRDGENFFGSEIGLKF
jgi:uncharacterized coiled-coil protein SlyX